jgi:TRAP-type mannitol/chloroaromatic compound transport system permease large subunit
MALTVIAAFALLFLFGFPVVVAIAVPAIIYIIAADIPFELIAQRMTYALDSFPLVAVPVFIFVGSLMNQSGITSDIYRFAHTLAGRVPGGLAQVNVIGSLIFSGVSGAALADIGGLGRIEVRAMVRAGSPGPMRARSPALRPSSGRSSRPRSRSSSTARSRPSRLSSSLLRASCRRSSTSRC